MPQDFPLDLGTLQRVLNCLNIGVYITDLERRIVLWNSKAEAITGHKAQDVLGRPCHANVLEHVDKDGHPLCSTQFCPLYKSMSTEQASVEPVLVFARHADGRRVGVGTSTAPLYDDEGRVVGGIETFTDETRRLRDLEFAKEVQRNLLPDPPSVVGARFDVRYYPHDLVGGDFYDIYRIEGGRTGFMVADVSGHGVSAALYTMWLKSLGEQLAEHRGRPAQYMAAINRELSRFVLQEVFATGVCGVLAESGDELEYCNAGHPQPLLRSGADSEISFLDTHGLPLGIFAEGEYESGRVAMAPGDTVLCYTDGATEARNADGDRLGQEGLARLFRECAFDGANVLEGIYRDIKRRAPGAAVEDDVLLLSITRPSTAGQR